MEDEEINGEDVNEMNDQVEKAKTQQENGAMWKPGEEYDEGWEVGREQYWSSDEDMQVKKAQDKGRVQHGQNQTSHGGMKSTSDTESSVEETNIKSEKQSSNEYGNKLVPVGHSDTQKGTSNSRDSDSSKKCVKELKVNIWEPNKKQRLIKESWEDDSLVEREEGSSEKRM